MDETKFRRLVKQIRGLEVRTPDGVGYTWNTCIERLGVTFKAHHFDDGDTLPYGPVFYNEQEIIRLNVDEST